MKKPIAPVPAPSPKSKTTKLQRCDRCKNPCRIWAEVFCYYRKGWRKVHGQYSERLCQRCLKKQSHGEGYSFPAIHDPFVIATSQQSRTKTMFGREVPKREAVPA